MIDGLNIDKKNSKLDDALASLSESEARILDSVLKNDEYRLKSTNNINPTVAQVARLPDIYGMGFTLIYNQLQELLGNSTKEPTGNSVDKGLGAIFANVGIGMQEFGKGLEFIGTGLQAMGSVAALAGVGVASLAMVAVLGFVAGLAALENKGVGLGTVIKGIFMGIAEGIVYFAEGILNALSGNMEFIEMVLDKLIEGIRELGPVIGEVAPIIVSGIEEISRVLISFIENLDNIITSIGKFAVALVDTLFDSITDTVERLSKLDGQNLLLVAGGVASLGVALVAFAAGSAVEGFIGFFTTDGLVEKLSRFAALGPNLSLTGAGIQNLADGLAKLAKVDMSTSVFLRKGEIDNVVEFILEFDRPDFKKALLGLGDSLPSFALFSGAFANLASGVESLADLDNTKYNKALGRVKELVALSKEAGINFEGLASPVLAERPKQVNDAIFTLDSSDAGGAYFNTRDGLVQTAPNDNLTVIASTNSPTYANGVQKFAEQVASDFKSLMAKLDNYVEVIASKQPDVTIIPNESGNQNNLNIAELLRVGI